MVEVHRSDVIPAAAARVWEVVRDFDALPRWTPFVAESRIEGGERPDRVGCVRAFTLRGGGRIRERLLMLDDDGRACRYAILDSPMAVEDYVAELRLTPVTTEGTTFAEWEATFDCPPGEAAALTAQIGDGVFAAGLAHLRRRFGG